MMDDSERAAWEAWRSHGIGASDVPAILGLSPWSGPYAVWVSKTQDRPSQPQTEKMTLGLFAEPFIESVFTHLNPGLLVVDRQLKVHHSDFDWARCTLDGRAVDASTGEHVALLEFKTTGDPRGSWDESIPLHYYAQVQWQMFVYGADLVKVAVLYANRGLGFDVHDVARDDSFIDYAFKECETFWWRHVVGGEPPPVDDSNATAEILDSIPARDGAVVELDGIADSIVELAALKAEANRLYKMCKGIESRVKAAMGEATVGTVNGRKVVSWSEVKRRVIPVAKLRVAAPDLASELEEVVSTRSLRLYVDQGGG